MTIKTMFLPVGLLLVIVLSLLAPVPGSVFQSWGVIPYLVVIIFLCNGYQTKIVFNDFNKKLLSVLLIAVIVSLVVAPVLASLLGGFIGLPFEMAIGLVVICAMPSTLSSGIVISNNAGGSSTWAILLTMGLNLCGIFSIPIVLTYLLTSASSIELSAWSLLLKLLLLVFVPFLLGSWCRSKVTIEKGKSLIAYVPSLCVMLAVWASLSASYEIMIAMELKMLLLAFFASFIFHGGLLVFYLLVAKGLHLSMPETKALVFVASQKTLPIAISVIAALAMETAGPAILICLSFHFLQLLFDSLIASKWA